MKTIDVRPGQIKKSDYIKIIVFALLFNIIMVVFMFGASYLKNLAGYTGGEPTECIVIDMHEEFSTRDHEYITTFLTNDGTEINIDSTYKDYIGRKTTLLVYGRYGFRKNFEINKLSGVRIVILVIMVFFWLSLIYYRVTKKIVIVDELTDEE